MILAAFCLLSATACALSSPAGPTPGLNEAFTLAPEETASIRGTSLRLRFVNVSGDSRCPADAICIQGGDAIVHIRVLRGPGDAEYRLHTGDASRGRVEHGDLKIELVELQPYPFSSRTIQPDEYRATLKVSR
jgi:hypothetical protein